MVIFKKNNSFKEITGLIHDNSNILRVSEWIKVLIFNYLP